MTNLNFTIAEDKCIQCDACVKDCPTGVIFRTNNIPFVTPESEAGCIRCQHCLAVCPTGAISIFGLKPENSLPIAPGSFPSYEQMKQYARGRRSVRQFKHENIPGGLIEKLLADAAHAPTGCNDCDLTFSVVDDRKDIERLRERIISLIENQTTPEIPEFIRGAAEAYRRNKTDPIFRGAPHLLVVSPGTKSHCGQEDAVLTLTYFELLAQSAGVGTTWCGMLKLTADAVPGVRELLGLEPTAYFYAMMFGLPDVQYARTVQRDNAAAVRTIKMK